MKKSDDLSQAFLLKHFPAHRRMSSTVPMEVSARNSVLLACAALIITVITSAVLIRETNRHLLDEQASRYVLEDRLVWSNAELARYKEINRNILSQNAEFSKEVDSLSQLAVKDEKIFFGKMTSLLDKYQISMQSPVKPASEIAQGNPPWSKAE